LRKKIKHCFRHACLFFCTHGAFQTQLKGFSQTSAFACVRGKPADKFLISSDTRAFSSAAENADLLKNLVSFLSDGSLREGMSDGENHGYRHII
jgi:hypothetical protein